MRSVGKTELGYVDCVTAGFPCQDISVSGSARRSGRNPGLSGARSGLFFEVVRILKEIQPAWVVLENVPALLSVNDCADFERVVRELAECGYVGFWRVLNARYFGVPQARRRIFLVAGLGRYPAMASHTLQATITTCQIALGCEILLAEENGWGSMVERARASEVHGLCAGLAPTDLAEAFGAGNAVCPPVAKWIAEILKRS